MAEPNEKPSKEALKMAAKKAGWVYSQAHGGWIHSDEYDPERGYHVQLDAEDACWLHDITPQAEKKEG